MCTSRTSSPRRRSAATWAARCSYRRARVQKLVAARLAADVLGVPTILLARTDAEAADLITSDVDENDQPFITGERTCEGLYRVKKGFDQALSRGLAYAAYADLVWCETGTPDLAFARRFAEGIHRRYPDKMLAYNFSPRSLKRNLDDLTSQGFSGSLAPWATSSVHHARGFHALNLPCSTRAQLCTAGT